MSVAMLTLGEYLTKVFRVALLGLLVGFAFLGRGLAHVGAPPLYISECVLFLGVLCILIAIFQLKRSIKMGVIEWLLLAFIALGAARTIPYIGQYGLDAPRDGVLWGYAVFTFAILLVWPEGERLNSVVNTYRSILPLLLVWIPIAGLLNSILPMPIPNGPGSDVGIVVFKGGDMGVHLSGAAAFLLFGLYSQGSGFRMSFAVLWTLWLFGAAVAGVSRGGLMAASVGILVASSLKPSKRMLQFFAVAAVLVLIAGLLDVKVKGSYEGREISVRQFGRSLQSLYSDDETQGGLQGTKEYRLKWWGKIVDYTFGGQYFWGGKGFGVNLADDDGFQVLADGSLRAPHNSHMTVLARMGVPGLSLWVALHVAFGASLLAAWFKSSKAGLTYWAAIDGWLLVYWLAACVNASFDPYLEGPQGGIWLWCVIGFGLYALKAQKVELLAVAEAGRAAVKERKRSRYSRRTLAAGPRLV
jgi:hypothetical protein